MYFKGGYKIHMSTELYRGKITKEMRIEMSREANRYLQHLKYPAALGIDLSLQQSISTYFLHCTNLLGCPLYITRASDSFYSSIRDGWQGDPTIIVSKDVTSLAGLPVVIAGDLKISDASNLTSFEGCPVYIRGDFKVSFIQGSSLEGMPVYVGGDVVISGGEELSTLEGIPRYIGSDLYISRSLGQRIVHESFEGGWQKRPPMMFPEDFKQYLRQYLGLVCGCTVRGAINWAFY